MVALDTVTDDENRADLSELERHVDQALPWLPAEGVVALMSQVPVGYTRALARRLREKRPDLRSRLYYWVETLVIGEAVARYLSPERIILGGSDWLGGPEAGRTPEPTLDALEQGVDVAGNADLRQWDGVHQVCDPVRAGTYMRIGPARCKIIAPAW